MNIIYLEDRPYDAESFQMTECLHKIYGDNLFLRQPEDFEEFASALLEIEEATHRGPDFFIIDIMIARERDLQALEIDYMLTTAAGYDAGLLLAKEYLRGKEVDKYGGVPILFYSGRSYDEDPTFSYLQNLHETEPTKMGFVEWRCKSDDREEENFETVMANWLIEKMLFNPNQED